MANNSLKIGAKIYYIDYEDSKNSYTIVKEPELNSFGQLVYTIHSDQLSKATGYYPLPVDAIDDMNHRFFSTQEKAHEAYVKFLNKRRQII